MKGLSHLVFGCAAGSILGTFTFVIIDTLVVSQPTHAIGTSTGSALGIINETWNTEDRKRKLIEQIARECVSARMIRDQALTLAEKNKTINKNHYNQALAISKRASALLTSRC